MINCKEHLTERGQKILTVAQQLFLQYGYEETSLEMIINEAGGSRRSIYSEFGNKEGLLKAVLKSRIATQIDVLASIDYQLPPDVALKEVCCRFVQGFVSPTMVSLFRLITQVVVKLPEIGELIFNEGPLKGVTPLADYLDHLNEHKILNIDDTHYAAQMLIEMAKGRLHLHAVLLTQTPISEEKIKTHIDKAVDLFLNAYQIKNI